MTSDGPLPLPNLQLINLKIFKNISKILNLETFLYRQHKYKNKQVRLAMVPRDSQQRPQLYEQLT